MTVKKTADIIPGDVDYQTAGRLALARLDMDPERIQAAIGEILDRGGKMQIMRVLLAQTGILVCMLAPTGDASDVGHDDDRTELDDARALLQKLILRYS